MYRDNYHYNLLNLKGSVIPTNHYNKKKEPKADERIFESKMKAIDEDINFADENFDTY